MAKFVLVALNSPTSDGDAQAVDAWYDTLHIPELKSIRGVTKARRYKAVRGRIPGHELWSNLAIYEIEADDLSDISEGLQSQISGFHPDFDRADSAHVFARQVAGDDDANPAAYANALFGYVGKNVVVSGCASGMGQATARLLCQLGANVHGLDRRKATIELASFHEVDLRDPASIDAAVEALPARLDAVFNCAGLGPTFSPMDIFRVNFVGTRYLTERLVPRLGPGGAIASIASTAGMGWSRNLDLHLQLQATTGFEEAVAWMEERVDLLGEGYIFSKEAIVVWTLCQSQRLIGNGIRINCTLPGLTQTPMLTDQIAVNTAPAVLEQVIAPFGRASTPEEQAFALAFLNSSAASYLNGSTLNVDGGRIAWLSLKGGFVG